MLPLVKFKKTIRVTNHPDKIGTVLIFWAMSHKPALQSLVLLISLTYSLIAVNKL